MICNKQLIQKRYLIAIEDQNFDELPGDFYIRAFIKQYADMVDLDGAELLKQFDSTLPSTQTQEYVDKVNESNPKPDHNSVKLMIVMFSYAGQFP